MPTIDEILDAMPEEEATTGRDYLVIDPSTRTITVPISEKVFGVEGDVDAQRKYFICPRYVGDNLDLASMFLSVYFRTATDYEDGYLVDDVAVNGDYVTFSWLLSSSITEHRGTVQFSVCADLPNSTNRRGPDWNTTIAQGDILEGLDPDVGDVEAETSDVVTQLRAEIAASTAAVEAAGAAQVDVVKAQGTNTTQEAVAAIQAQGAATNASIPADYAALAAQVDTLTRGRAAAIVCEAAGAAIQVQDASDDPLQGLRIFGKSTQDGTPTPDAPVEIVSLAAPVVRVAGKNLLPWPYRDGTTKTHGGLTYTVQEDGGVYVTGTVTAAESYFVFSDFNFGEKSVGMGKSNGVYFWTDCLYNVARHFTMLYFSQGNVVDRVYYPQVETGTEATEYEAPAGQTLTITTPGSLHGIPVASGGNYTDANGQQWICDEVDLARGVYVQRVKTVRLETACSGMTSAAGTSRWLSLHISRLLMQLLSHVQSTTSTSCCVCCTHLCHSSPRRFGRICVLRQMLSLSS